MNHSKNNRRSSRNRAGTLLTGVVIGLIIGVAVVVGVVLYFTQTTTPFTNLQKMEQRLTTNKNKTPTASSPPTLSPRTSTPPPPSSTTKQTPHQNQQRFDFYKILPQQDVSGASNRAPKPQAATQASNDLYYLQVGSFQNQAEAEHLKAQLAFLSIEASIQTMNTTRGLVYRVRVGPFSQPADADKVRRQLKEEGIGAMMTNK